MSCAAAVKAALESVEGCEEAKADWEKGWAWAKYDPKKTSPEELVEAINEKTAFHATLRKTPRRVSGSLLRTEAGRCRTRGVEIGVAASR